MLYPKDVDGTRKVLRPHYNRAGALERVELSGTTYVEHIAYNAKGQRTLIAYGNGVMTRYAYDEQTFRLVRMRTERYEVPAGSMYVYHPKDPSKPLQDFAYEYDLVGNILKITDRTPCCGVVNTPSGKDALSRLFTYDPLYRLISATGRECLTILKPRPWEDWRDAQNCGCYDGKLGTPNQDNAPDLTTMYWETYVYDPAGNMVTLQHGKSVGPDWTRHFGMGGLTPQQWRQEWPAHLNATGIWSDPPSNCLTHVGDNQPGVLQNHFYDENGNLVKENTERHFEWDHSDRMRVFRTQAGNAEPSKHAHYFYDATGQRVKKLLRKQGGQVGITVYIDGMFEFHRLVKPSETIKPIENNTLHVMDNQSHIAMVRVGDAFPDDGAPNVMVKYHLGDHLGSSNVVIDDTGNWVNREEYFPYGETSFGGFARKRYRFTGKEQDEESGLYYHGVRYYAPWLARWVSCDPEPTNRLTSAYKYCHNSPIRFVDPTGETDTNAPTSEVPKAELQITIDHIEARNGPLEGDPVDPWNLQFMTSSNNSWWKRENLEGDRQSYAPQSLKEALESGDFNKAAQNMLDRSFAETIELNLGREKLNWSKETWANIDKAVHDEAQRVRIAMKYIPIYMTTADALSIPAETIETEDADKKLIPLAIDEGKTISIFEILTGFSMTTQQVSLVGQGDMSTAISLATRATNLLMQGEDILLFQGDHALKRDNGHPLFTSGRILHRNKSFGPGLLGAVAALPDPATQTTSVDPTRVDTETVALNRYGENTFGAVSEAYSRLQSKGHYGPYALALHSDIYADTFAPLPTTLIMPADRIKPLVTAGFYGTGTLPFHTGVLVSLGGNTMDLVVGMDAITTYLQDDTGGLCQFRVFERFALRVKDVTAIIKLVFNEG